MEVVSATTVVCIKMHRCTYFVLEFCVCYSVHRVALRCIPPSAGFNLSRKADSAHIQWTIFMYVVAVAAAAAAAAAAVVHSNSSTYNIYTRCRSSYVPTAAATATVSCKLDIYALEARTTSSFCWLLVACSL